MWVNVCDNTWVNLNNVTYTDRRWVSFSQSDVLYLHLHFVGEHIEGESHGTDGVLIIEPEYEEKILKAIAREATLP